MNAPVASPSRPSPFLLPAETDGRFGMLVTAATLAWGAATTLALASPALVTIAPHVLALRDGAADLARMNTFTADEAQLQRAAQLARTAAGMLLEGLAPALEGMVLLWLGVGFAAWGLYRSHAWRYRRRWRPARLHATQAPGLVRDMGALAASVGMHLPALEWSPGVLDGHAYGGRGRESLLLRGTPEMLNRTWHGHGRAVALHEFAHVVNDDIHLREWSQAICLAVGCGLAALALALGTTLPPGAPRALAVLAGPSLGLGLAAMALLVASIWVQLVRVREHYADARAAEWGAARVLHDVLGLLSRRRFHPSPERRRQVLEDAQPLLGVSPGLALQTGALLGLSVSAVPWLAIVVNLVALSVVEPRYLALAASVARFSRAGCVVVIGVGLLFRLAVVLGVTLAALAALGHLTTRVLGQQVQREALYDVLARPAARWRYLPLMLPAFLFALGVEAAFLLTPATPWRLGSAASLARAAVWLPCWTILNWLWLVYVRALSRFALGTHCGASPPRARMRGVSLASSLVLFAFLVPALFGRVTLPFIDAALFRQGAVLPGRELSAPAFFVVNALGGTALLFTFALAAFAALALASWLGVAVWLRLRARRCPSCGEPYTGFAAGARCGGCDLPLAPWTLPAASVLLTEVRA